MNISKEMKAELDKLDKNNIKRENEIREKWKKSLPSEHIYGECNTEEMKTIRKECILKLKETCEKYNFKPKGRTNI